VLSVTWQGDLGRGAESPRLEFDRQPPIVSAAPGQLRFTGSRGSYDQECARILDRGCVVELDRGSEAPLSPPG